jgi:hypothetical protein
VAILVREDEQRVERSVKDSVSHSLREGESGHCLGPWNTRRPSGKTFALIVYHDDGALAIECLQDFHIGWVPNHQDVQRGAVLLVHVYDSVVGNDASAIETGAHVDVRYATISDGAFPQIQARHCLSGDLAIRGDLMQKVSRAAGRDGCIEDKAAKRGSYALHAGCLGIRAMPSYLVPYVAIFERVKASRLER